MRAPIYNVLERHDRATWTIQPPLLGWAWEQVAARSPQDPGFAAEGVAPVAALHRWLERERAPPARGSGGPVATSAIALDAVGRVR